MMTSVDGLSTSKGEGQREGRRVIWKGSALNLAYRPTFATAVGRACSHRILLLSSSLPPRASAIRRMSSAEPSGVQPPVKPTLSLHDDDTPRRHPRSRVLC